MKKLFEFTRFVRPVTRVVTGAIVAMTLTTPALAGGSAGSITFGAGGAQAVPALGTALAVLLALLLGFMALLVLKRRAGTLSAVGAFLATGALLTSVGVPLVERAVGAGMTFLITNASSQTFAITPNDISTYENDSGAPVSVLSVTLPSGACGPASVALNDPSECSVGTTLADGDFCSVDCATAQGSDLRLKTDVLRVGTTHNNLPLYHFRYKGDSTVYEGVMAQDVIRHFPEAVIARDDGYLAVNYAALGLRMRRVGD